MVMIGGTTVGSTDELGLYAVEDKVHVHDLHATMMAMLGLDPNKVIYMHKGRPERVEQNGGSVIESIMKA